MRAGEGNIQNRVQNKDSRLAKWIRDNEDSLVHQSRSFAIPIRNLDHRFRIPVMVEYNLNKTVDTIEDSIAIDSDEKISLIRTFCDHLENDDYSHEVKKRMLEVTPKEEAYVFKNYESTLGLFNTLSGAEKALAKRWTTEMAEGMCTFLKKTIQNTTDLNDYCYCVAGTVGIYLTSLLKLHGHNISKNVISNLEENAVPFGLFLQKLNIIRDYEEDKEKKKRSFWPKDLLKDEKDPVKILNSMCYETLINDVPKAIEYIKEIPAGNESYDYFLRFIFSSGIEYLKILKNNAAVFLMAKVKLPRAFIKSLYARVSTMSREEFGEYCEKTHAEEMALYGKILR